MRTHQNIKIKLILIVILSLTGLSGSISTRQNLPIGFVYLENVIPGITIELRYFSSNNFIRNTIDGYEGPRCIITGKAAAALMNVQIELNENGLGLKIFDAYRPQQAVDHFVRWAKDLSDTLNKNQYYPEVPKSELFERGYISARSGHTRGSTLDLTIIYVAGENTGKELDMGTPWDFFSTKSWPSSELVTAQQKSNRDLLRDVMTKHGFKPLKEEWWHFTLQDEPYPDTYFNFPVR